MNLKFMIRQARLNGVPVYCIILLILYAVVQHFERQSSELVPEHLHKYLKFDQDYAPKPKNLSASEIETLSSIIDLLNYEREIFNKGVYGQVTRDTTVIAIQVHQDVERLQYLIIQLAQVQFINRTLIIFSHSFYDEGMNKLIFSIDFCRFAQIFYPYSNQLFPDTFPGSEPEDCNNARYLTTVPKDLCSTRDARATEHKHHWWWKAHFIFGHFDWSEGYRGSVIFLEENDFVLPDLLHMLKYTERAMSTIPGVILMSFGRPYAKDLDYDLLLVDSWRPPYDVGLTVNKATWHKILTLASSYCMYDDISWSYSMLNLFGKIKKGQGDMVACLAPRVLSTRMFPSGRVAMQKLTDQFKKAKLFPERVRAVMVYGSDGRVSKGVKAPPKGNGGWNDIRDHLLCLDPFMATTDGNGDTDSARDGSSFDFIIVGGGTTGSTLAARLAEVPDFTVLLIEAGGDPPLESIIPGFRDVLKSSPYDWNFTTINDGFSSQGLFGGRQLQPRGKMLGGSGSLNDMVYARGHPVDYDEWATILGDDWNWRNVIDYFKKTEHITDEKIINDVELLNLHGRNGEIEVSGSSESTLTTQKLLDAFRELGFSVVNDMTYPYEIGAGRFSHTVRQGKRDSSLTALLNKVESRNLYILKNALVTNVLLENSTAVGVKVQVNDSEVTLYAHKEVIISAGTFNTAKLMLLSGIGPKDHLDELDIDVVKDLPVGENLHDHVMVVTYLAADVGTCTHNEPTQYFEMIKYFYDHTGTWSFSDSMGAYIPKSGGAENIPYFALYPSCIPQNTLTYDTCVAGASYLNDTCEQIAAQNKEYELFPVAVVLLKPKSRGNVTLNIADPTGDPLIHTGTFSDGEDFEGYSEAMKIAWSLINTTYFKEKNAHVVDLKIAACQGLVDDDFINCYVKNMAMSAWHSVGTAAMGTVVNAKLQVLGVDGLRVVDASVMPVIIRGNTNAPVVMIAEKAADFIKNTYGMT